jgi:hypothetical protein
MLRKSLAVLGLFSLMILADPADAGKPDWVSKEGPPTWVSDVQQGQGPPPHARGVPAPSMPEPGAALLFGAGALLVRRRLRRR